MELKLKALILDEVHNIEVVRLLLEHKVNHVGHWYWQKQLRFYLRNSECEGDGNQYSVTAFCYVGYKSIDKLWLRKQGSISMKAELLYETKKEWTVVFFSVLL